MKIILINGPAGSGKDTMAEKLKDKLGYFTKLEKFAKPIKLAVAAIYFGGNYEAFAKYDTFEAKKVPAEVFLGKTPREVQIAVSEFFLKPYHEDKRVFGKLMATRLKMADINQHVLVSDSGFREEAEELVDQFGAENILLVRLHREGYTFDGDSRSYINLDDLGVATLDIENEEGKADETAQKIYNIIQGV